MPAIRQAQFARALENLLADTYSLQSQLTLGSATLTLYPELSQLLGEHQSALEESVQEILACLSEHGVASEVRSPEHTPAKPNKPVPDSHPVQEELRALLNGHEQLLERLAFLSLITDSSATASLGRLRRLSSWHEQARRRLVRMAKDFRLGVLESNESSSHKSGTHPAAPYTGRHWHDRQSYQAYAYRRRSA
jgi:hypothetical protein